MRIALGVKGVAYSAVFVNLAASAQSAPEYLEMSPTGHVPCLVVDGKPMSESVAIVELLEDLFPSPALYPSDPWARAQVRSLVEIVNSGTQPLQNLHVIKHLSSEQPVREAWARHFIARGLAAFEVLMERHHADGVRGQFAYGDTLTAADCFLVPQVYNANRFGVDLAGLPRVRAAHEAALSTDVVRAAAPEAQGDFVQ